MIYTDENWKPPVTYCEPNKVEVQRMTRQEAIKELTYVKIKLKEANVFVSPSMDIAIDMAIEALQDDWVPVSEKLPEKNGDYIVSLEDAVDTSASFFNGKWFMSSFDCISREYGEYEVVAWRPIPAPYKGE